MATKTRPAARTAKTRTAGPRIPRDEALKRLAEKEVTPAYRPPRGNQELDRDALAISVGASERLLTH